MLARETGQRRRVEALELVDGVPPLAEGGAPFAAPRMVMVPMELLLLRAVTLPLSHPRFVDGDVLAQELEEQAGIDAEAWWLAWRVDRLEGGCSGVVVAMPRAMQQQIAAHPVWSHAPVVTVDGWVRLQRWLDGVTGGEEAPLAVVDADADGLFFGCYRGGCWLGMRRLNRLPEGDDSALMMQLLRSLRSMGWRDGAVVGRLDEELRAAWVRETGGEAWNGQVESTLPARLESNVDAALAGDGGLNFRHGRWSATAAGLAEWRSWRRPAALAALALLVWYGQQQWTIADLQARSAAVEAQIAAAFHRGLPDQAVMLDPLAQLQQAAESVGGGSDRQRLLRQLALVAAVYRQVPWTMRALRLEDGVVRLRGSVPDLETLNRVHDLLQKRVGHKVTIEDTDLRKASVGFRMRWS